MPGQTTGVSTQWEITGPQKGNKVLIHKGQHGGALKHFAKSKKPDTKATQHTIPLCEMSPTGKSIEISTCHRLMGEEKGAGGADC